MLLLPFVFNKLAKFACQLNEGEHRHGGRGAGWQRRLMLYGSDFYFLFPPILNYCYGRREGVFVYAYRSYIALFIAQLVGIFISLCVFLCVCMASDEFNVRSTLTNGRSLAMEMPFLWIFLKLENIATNLNIAS